MPAVTAYLCPWTKSLFRSKEAYLKHLRKHRSFLLKDIRRNRALASLEDWYRCPTPQSIVEWVDRNPTPFYDNALYLAFGDKRSIEFRKEFKLEIAHLVLRWTNHASNSHSAPRDGITNWGHEDGKPTGYPGWTGRICFRLNKDIGFSSNVFKETCLNTGSGGGSEWVEYSVTLFDSDWPGLSQTRVWNILAGKDPDKMELSYRRHLL